MNTHDQHLQSRTEPTFNVDKLVVWVCIIGASFVLGIQVGYIMGEKDGIAKANGVCKIVCEQSPQEERINSKMLDMIERALEKVPK